MKIPKALKPKDKIVILSPAGKVAPEIVYDAQKRLSEELWEVEISEHALGSDNKFSGSDIERLEDIKEAVNDYDIKAIFCSRGGYGSMRIVDKIDWSAMRENPKFVIGFSDVTVLHAALYLEGIVSVHAVMAKDVVHGDAEAVSSLLLSLKGVKPDIHLSTHYMNRLGSAKGTIVGGNLSILYALRGTKYDLDWTDKILFIEDVGENLYHIDRIMQNLRLGDKLSKLAGLVVGQFTDMEDEEFGKSAYEIINAAVSEFDYPVVFNAPIGHYSGNQSVLHGAEVCLDVSKDRVELIYL